MAVSQFVFDFTEGSKDQKELLGGKGRELLHVEVAALDPAIVKNEGYFNAVEIIIPEGCIAHPPPNKPAALGSFHPACEITEAVCIALSQVAPERSQPMSTPSAKPAANTTAQRVLARDRRAKAGVNGWAGEGA